MDEVEDQLRRLTAQCCSWQLTPVTTERTGHTDLQLAVARCALHDGRRLYVKTFRGADLLRGQVQASASPASGPELDSGHLHAVHAEDGSTLRIFQRDVGVGRTSLDALTDPGARREGAERFCRALGRAHETTAIAVLATSYGEVPGEGDHRVVHFTCPCDGEVQATRADRSLGRWIRRDPASFPASWTPRIEKALLDWPELSRQRVLAGELSVIHGDVSGANVFVAQQAPRPGLIDWECASTAPGAFDLSYFLALTLKPDARREIEPALLRAYRDGRGWSGRDGLERTTGDFRLGLVGALLVALAWKRWEPLRCVVTAIDDWDAWTH